MNKYDEAIEKINTLIDVGCGDCTVVKPELKLALEALQQAKERSVGCEYCNEFLITVNNPLSDLSFGRIFETEYEGEMCIATDGEKYYIYYEEEESGENKAEIHACPICSRKLGEKHE